MDSTNTEQARHIGDLRLIRKIAAGGMAEVWEARKEGLEGFSKRVAVKVILPHLTENDDFIRMFLDEGRLAARLDHPNICQIMDLGEDNGTYYMSMEYIDGVVLSTIMKEAAKRGLYIPFEYCCQVAIGACAGLDYAHSAVDHEGNPLNLVHRDISPQNIMITFDGNVKVVDFGIAKAATQLHHTRAGVLKGKYAYMSPEQATGDPLDRRSDVFAMGVVLWEMTTGHRLFREENEIATLHKIIGGDYPSPSSFRDSYPPELELIINKALAMDRNNRFRDCGEMQLALEDFLLRNGMAAGSKRLAYYVRWLLSDEEMPDLSSQAVSAVSLAFEQSDPGVNTPSANSQAFPGAFPTPAASMANAPTRQMGSYPEPGVVASEEGRLRQPRKRSGGLWIALLLLLILGGGGLGAYFLLAPQKTMTVFRPWLVNSEPRDATIFLNGEKVGKTPYTLMVRLGQKYHLRVEKSGFTPFHRSFMQLEEKDVKRPLLVRLSKESQDVRYGFVTINVKPAKATVLLDGQKLEGSTIAGVTIFSGRVRAGTKHAILIKAPGYQDYADSNLTIKANAQRVFTVLLKRKRSGRRYRRPRPRRRRPRRWSIAKRRVRRLARQKGNVGILVIHPGKLRVTSSPPGAIVKIDGEVVGSTPMGGFVDVEPDQSHKLQVIKEEHQTYTQTFRLRSKERRTIRVQLKSAKRARPMSYVSFASSIKSVVYLNGKRIGVTPFFRKIPQGRYVVEFRTLKFGASHRQTLTFGAGAQRFFHRFQMGRLWVLSKPIARVYIGGDYLGKSMQPPYRLPAGRYRVRLTFPNGKSVFKTVHVKVGQKTRLKVIQR